MNRLADHIRFIWSMTLTAATILSVVAALGLCIGALGIPSHVSLFLEPILLIVLIRLL